MGIEVGTIILWLGARGAWDATEWEEYTPAQGRFIRGSAASPGLTGGGTTHTHTLGSVISGGAHTHAAKAFDYGGSSGTVYVIGGSGRTVVGDNHTHTSSMTLNSGGAHTHTLSTASTGGPVGSTEPTYKKLIYLIKKKFSYL